MITLLGGPEDDDLLWLAAALREHGEETYVVRPQEIVDGALRCRIDSTGVSSTLRLRDGRSIGEPPPSLVINRLTELPIRPARSPIDSAYLAEEWRAAIVAWLRTVSCPVLNPPRAASLIGPVLAHPAWLAVARAHGLPCRTWTSDDLPMAGDPVDLFVVGRTCLDPTHAAPRGLRDRLCRVSQFLGAPLLSARFDRADGWCFVAATTVPRLMDGGEPLVDAIIQESTMPERMV